MNLEIQKQRTNLSYALSEGIISIIINTVLFCLKIWVGLVTGSVAFIADAWHTLSDSLTSVIVIFCSVISNKSADSDHPYGHGRMEMIGAIILGNTLALIGIKFLVDSIQSIQNQNNVNYGWFAVGITVLSIVLKESLAQFAFWTAKKSGGKSLRADAWHHRSDAISSLVLLVGIFLRRYISWIDGILGIIISLLILYAAYDILKDTISTLLGENADFDFIAEIKDLAKESYPNELRLHHVHLHHYGWHTELTFHIQLPTDMTIKEAHDIANKIEKNIKEKKGIETTIHIEPNG